MIVFPRPPSRQLGVSSPEHAASEALSLMAQSDPPYTPAHVSRVVESLFAAELTLPCFKLHRPALVLSKLRKNLADKPIYAEALAQIDTLRDKWKEWYSQQVGQQE